ncbi:MAG: AAA family ATPase [Sphingobacterium composti]|uniref:AAA family ATPase n=1 Tax=Sphingobacterium composti TaxID=363260 RepID=UPI00135ACC0A|nr:SMC family ATPase [Sphingobacterium composti Ten et al. 2007 non Yoo et al. 2007]
MLPLYLSIEGLYSYQQKQEIDFTKLTEAGLFGIFGTVGSGKSSVLEAIGYALYGETERLNSKEKRTYNMLNLKSNHVLIDFQFLNFEGRKFRFVAQWRRKKKFQDITDHERNAYEWKDNAWVPLGSNDGATVTNLSYPNFRRTIIIPQGQFKEFLELKGKDRSEMMKEIFFLNQYDLGPKVSHLLADNNKKIENIKGALSAYDEVNEEVILDKTEQFDVLAKTLDTIKDDYQVLEKKFNELETTKQMKLDLVAKKEELSSLEQKKIHIQKAELEVNEFELISSNFREHLNNFTSITSSKNTLLTKIEGLKESKDKTKSLLIEVEKSLEDITPKYEGLDELKTEIQDIKRLKENLTSLQAKNEKEAGIIKGQEFLNTQKIIEENLAGNIQELEKEIERLKSNQIKSSELLEIDTWYQKEQQFQKDLSEKKQQIQETLMQIEDLKNKFKALGCTETDWKDVITQKKELLSQSEENIKNQESELRLKQELAHYAHNLHDGEACPLCGSLEHPSPMQIDTLDKEFVQITNDKNELIAKKQELDKQIVDLQLASRIIVEKEHQCRDFNESVLGLGKLIEIHHSSFKWEDFDKTDKSKFDKKKSAIFEEEEKLKLLDQDLKTKREQLQKTIDTITKSERKLNEYLNEVKILEASIVQNLQQIQVIDISLYKVFDENTLDEKSKLIESTIRETQTKYTNYTKQLLEYRTNYAEIQGAYNEAKEQYSIYAAKLQETQNLLHKLLVEFNYPDIATINAILIKNLNINLVRKNIQDFYLQYNTLQQRIQELEEKTITDGYSIEKHKEIAELVQLKKEELQLQIEIYGALKEDIERLTIDFSKKKELLASFGLLETRKKNLDILFNMFKGNGFVNYVSSIHLQRLCEIANQRFHRLTKNQLSLVINENNEFEVVDYLNNGYKRSAKTLSGGQSFQASLCLALALAENIQSLNKADKNFFFIDEGFGTQDTDSINTVFDTLQYLHQENRVVGIISHVEELKERMPRSITVIKDLDKGSQIIIN